MIERELPRIRVEVEELAVATPVDRDLELLSSLVLGEAPPQQIEEEALSQVPVLGGLQGVADRRTSGARSRARRAKICFDSRMSAATNVRPSSVTSRSASSTSAKPEHLRGVDQGEQVVDLERQLVGELGQILAPAVGDQDLEKTGHAAHTGLGQRGVDRRTLSRGGLRSRCGRAGGCRGRS